MLHLSRLLWVLILLNSVAIGAQEDPPLPDLKALLETKGYKDLRKIGELKQAYEKDHDWETYRISLQKILQDDPHFPMVYIRLAELYREKGMALEFNQNNNLQELAVLECLKLAQAAYEKEEYQTCRDHLFRAIHTQEHRYAVFYLFGNLELKQGNFRDAQQHFQAARAHAPADKRDALQVLINLAEQQEKLQLLEKLAKEYFKEENYIRAAPLYWQLYEEKPEREDAGLLAARANAKIGMLHESKELLEKLSASKTQAIRAEALEVQKTVDENLAKIADQGKLLRNKAISPEDLLHLGSNFMLGQGVPQDDYEAFTCWKMAAEKGQINAMVGLGQLYEGGRGATQSYTEAALWYHTAADKGNTEGAYRLALLYAHGQGLKEDTAEAFKWYLKAAEGGVKDAQYNLACLYKDGSGVAQDYAQALRWFKAAAEQNDADAQSWVGICYQRGWGVEKDPKEAVKWYRKAAEQEDSSGQRLLGWMYLHGVGLEKDKIEAAKLYRKSAEQGDLNAMGVLGELLHHGNNDFEARKWLEHSAREGDAWGQFQFGKMYENGWGVEEDPVESVKWLTAAADQDLVEAQTYLATKYATGFRVEINDTKAVYWYRKAAEAGDVHSQFEVGRRYETGEGVPANKTQALKWYKRAADQEHADAKEAVKRLGK